MHRMGVDLGVARWMAGRGVGGAGARGRGYGEKLGDMVAHCGAYLTQARCVAAA